MVSKDTGKYFIHKLEESKEQFERTIDCKHTAFDDLYPYMNEQPQFFWYKRYVAWQELLTTVKHAEDLDVNWKDVFNDSQQSFIDKQVLDAKVLDEWYGKERKEA
nr:hypothetical protein [Sinobaca qinghaiensis]